MYLGGTVNTHVVTKYSYFIAASEGTCCFIWVSEVLVGC